MNYKTRLRGAYSPGITGAERSTRIIGVLYHISRAFSQSVVEPLDERLSFDDYYLETPDGKHPVVFKLKK